MVNLLRYKRSTANLPATSSSNNPATPSKSKSKHSSSSSTPIHGQHAKQSSPMAHMPSPLRLNLPEGSVGVERYSGASLIPSDGYSGLFASGLTNTHHSPSPRPPHHPPPSSYTQPDVTHCPNAINQATPQRRQHRRRRSSITATSNTSPAKYKSNPGGAVSPVKLKPNVSGVSKGMDRAVERRLDHVMKDLKLYTNASQISPIKQSRWSSSSEESIETAPRKSGESVRSTRSVRSKISTKMSIKSRRSEERMRPSMEEMEIDVPPLPPMPPIPAHAPVTPRRLAGLRRFLTPKKKMGPPPTPAPICPLPIPPSEPMPELTKKSSISTLRSLAKKTSTTTLRSANPSTPSRTKKPSIGPPVNLPSVSPSFFLDLMPRRAPTTPKKTEESPTHLAVNTLTPHKRSLPVNTTTPHKTTGDTITPHKAPADTITPLKSASTPSTDTPELSFDTPRADSSFSNTPQLDTPDFPQDPCQIGQGVNMQYGTPGWTPLTAKAKLSAKMRNGRNLTNFLPRQAQFNAGVDLSRSTDSPGASTPSFFSSMSMPRPVPTGIRGLRPPPPPTQVPGASRGRDLLGILARHRVKPSGLATDSMRAESPFDGDRQDGWSTPFVVDYNNNKEQGRAGGYFGGTFGRGTIPSGSYTYSPSTPDSARGDITTEGGSASGLAVSQRSRIDFTASPRPLRGFLGSSVTADHSPTATIREQGNLPQRQIAVDSKQAAFRIEREGPGRKPEEEEEELGRMSIDSEASSMITREEWELESHLRSIEEREVGVGR